MTLQLGYPDRSRRLAEEALRLAQNCGNSFNVGFVYMYAVVLYCSLGDPQRLNECADALRHLGDNNPAFVSIADLAGGLALSMQGRRTEGMAFLLGAMTHHDNLAFRLLHPKAREAEAEFCMHEGRLDDAQRVIADAMGDTEEIGLLKARILTQYADICSQNGAGQSATESAYSEAIECAHNQANRFDELRSTIQFARWLKTQDRGLEARTKLSAIYTWFTEGFDTAVLKEAKALLEELD